jgi:hypothetical protein
VTHLEVIAEQMKTLQERLDEIESRRGSVTGQHVLWYPSVRRPERLRVRGKD